MSKSDMPPVPPAGRGAGGSAAEAEDQKSDKIRAHDDPGKTNIDKQARTGNIKINTTNQGYQQDR